MQRMGRTLRNKILSAAVVRALIAISFVYSVLSFVVMPRFDALDTAAVGQNVVRIHNALDGDAADLTRILLDWAEWDTTYRFAVGDEPGYLQDNLDPKTFTDLHLDVFDLYDPSGRLVWSRSRDLGAGPSFVLPAAASASSGDAPLPTTGIVETGGGPVLFAAGPILDSRGAGSPHGRLVVGRLLDGAAIAALEAQTVAPIELWPVARAAEYGLGAGGPDTTALAVDRQGDWLQAAFLLPEPGGSPGFGVTTRVERQGHKTGTEAVEVAMACVLALAVASIFAMAFVMELVVVRRLTRLAQHMTQLGRSGALERFEDGQEEDEVGRVTHEFNRMVDMLAETRRRDEEQAEAYRRAMIAAQAASEAKSRFLAHMSHELRTPLNAIIGFAEIMEGEMMGPIGTPAYRGYAGDIGFSGQHLLSLVDDLLDLSRAETGEDQLHEQPIDLRALLDDVLRIMTHQARRAGITLAAEMPVALRLLADPRLCRQMLLNLLGNALKFTPRGGRIDIMIERHDDGSTLVSVVDSGIGMAAEDLPVVLQPFGQAATDPMIQSRGIGLGIPLTKHFIEQHGGSFTLSSVIGEGTRASLVFPASRAL